MAGQPAEPERFMTNRLYRMPPGKNMDDWFTIARSGMWRLWFKLTAEGKKRYFGEFMEVLHQTK